MKGRSPCHCAPREDEGLVFTSEVRQSAFLTTRRRIEGQIATSLRSSRRRLFGPRRRALRRCERSAAICLFDHHEKDSRADRHVAALLAKTKDWSLRAKRGNLPVNLVVNKEAGGFKQGDRFVPREDDYSAREDARFVVASEARQSAFLTITRKIQGQIATSLRSSRRRRIGLCERSVAICL